MTKEIKLVSGISGNLYIDFERNSENFGLLPTDTMDYLPLGFTNFIVFMEGNWNNFKSGYSLRDDEVLDIIYVPTADVKDYFDEKTRELFNIIEDTLEIDDLKLIKRKKDYPEEGIEIHYQPEFIQCVIDRYKLPSDKYPDFDASKSIRNENAVRKFGIITTLLSLIRKK